MIMNRNDAFVLFDEIFHEVRNELALSDWWDLFDSEQMREVEWRIAKALEVDDISEVEWFDEWLKKMADDLYK